MLRAWTKFSQDGEMRRCRVSLVLCEAITRIFGVHVHAICVSCGLGENGCRRDEKGLRIAFHDIDGMGQCRYGKTVDKYVHERGGAFRLGLSTLCGICRHNIVMCAFHRQMGRTKDVKPVYLCGCCGGYCPYAAFGVFDCFCKRVSFLFRKLFGIVYGCPFAAHELRGPFERQMHRCREHGTGKRSASCFIYPHHGIAGLSFKFEFHCVHLIELPAKFLEYGRAEVCLPAVFAHEYTTNTINLWKVLRYDIIMA